MEIYREIPEEIRNARTVSTQSYGILVSVFRGASLKNWKQFVHDGVIMMNIVKALLSATCISILSVPMANGYSWTQFGGGTGAKVYMIASVAEYEPYNYLDINGMLQGFESDLAKQICTRADITCEWTLTPWDELIPDLLAGKYDVVMSSLQVTPGREIVVDFTQDYFPADPSAFIALEGASPPISNQIVGAQTGTLQADYVVENGWVLAAYDTPEDALAALEANAISAFVSDQAYLEEMIAIKPDTFDLVETNVVIGVGLAMALPPTSVTLKAEFDAALSSLKADGTLDALIGQWFNGRDPNYRTQP